MSLREQSSNLVDNIKWFNPNDLLSYNCLLNFVVGDRGGGKTFNTLVFLVNRFKYHGEQFIYLRRTDVEVKDSITSLFSDLIKEGYFKDHELRSDRKGLYFDGKLMGLPKALSTSMSRKSISLPNVKWILFEEFMVDGKSSRYLHNEVFVFQNFYETVNRIKDLKGQGVRVLFLSNAFSTVNIYFQAYKVKIPLDRDKQKRYKRYNKSVAVCIWHEESYQRAKKSSEWYQLNEGTDFINHAYSNDFMMDSDKFIKPNKSKGSEYHFAFIYNSVTYTVWVDWSKGYYYVTTKGGDLTPATTISLTLEDNQPNNVNIRRVKAMPFMKAFRLAVDENRVYYDKLSTHHNLSEVVYLLQTTR